MTFIESNDKECRMSPARAAAIRALARSHRKSILFWIDSIKQIVRVAWQNQGEKDLPERARVVITYDGSNGRGSIQGVAINLSAGSDEQPENHVLYLDSRLSKRSFELVELLTRVAGHDSWKEGYGSCGTFEVDLHSGNVDRFRHMTRVMSLESENLDMRELLDTARMAA